MLCSLLWCGCRLCTCGRSRCCSVRCRWVCWCVFSWLRACWSRGLASATNLQECISVRKFARGSDFPHLTLLHPLGAGLRVSRMLSSTSSTLRCLGSAIPVGVAHPSTAGADFLLGLTLPSLMSISLAPIAACWEWNVGPDWNRVPAQHHLCGEFLPKEVHHSRGGCQLLSGSNRRVFGFEQGCEVVLCEVLDFLMLDYPKDSVSFPGVHGTEFEPIDGVVVSQLGMDVTLGELNPDPVPIPPNGLNTIKSLAS